MKNRIAIAVCLAAVLAVGAGVITTTHKHEYVILKGEEIYYTYRNGLPDNCGDGYHYAGIFLRNASGSAGAPRFEWPMTFYTHACVGQTNAPAIQLTECAAVLSDAGFDCRFSEDGLTLTATK